MKINTLLGKRLLGILGNRIISDEVHLLEEGVFGTSVEGIDGSRIWKNASVNENSDGNRLKIITIRNNENKKDNYILYIPFDVDVKYGCEHITGAWPDAVIMMEPFNYFCIVEMGDLAIIKAVSNQQYYLFLDGKLVEIHDSLLIESGLIDDDKSEWRRKPELEEKIIKELRSLINRSVNG